MSDAAFALGVLNVVLSEHREDREFISKHTLGWEAFRQRILEFPPSRVAGITGLPAESFRPFHAVFQYEQKYYPALDRSRTPAQSSSRDGPELPPVIPSGARENDPAGRELQRR